MPNSLEPEFTAREWQTPYTYCWCGHLRGGHKKAIKPLDEKGNNGEKPKSFPICDGNHPPNDPMPCDCVMFVPVEVATFRMLQVLVEKGGFIGRHIYDLKLLIGSVVSSNMQQEEELIAKPGGPMGGGKLH